MKKIVLQIVLFILLAGSSVTAYAGTAAYTTKEVPICRGEEEIGTVVLRFYEEKPNIACIGINQYFQMVREYAVSVEKEADGTYTIKSPSGGEAVVDVEEGTICSEAWPVFNDDPLPQEGRAKGYLDAGCGFVRITDIEYVGEDVPLTFDLGKYGISMYGEEDEVYLPLSTISNLLSDIATNYALYNGDAVIIGSLILSGESYLPPLYHSSFYDSLVSGEMVRPKDLIEQSYGDICLSFDTMFGHPEKSEMDAVLKEKGFEQAVISMGREGRKLLKNLKSPDYTKYALALTSIISMYLNDGHTIVLSTETLAGKDIATTLELAGSLLGSGDTMSRLADTTSVESTRKIFWGDELYREMGNIGVIRLDDFGMKPDEWADYYENGGEIPQDAFGITVSGLRKAAENPEIDTILFDLTANGGGSSDELMGIMSLVTDQTVLTGTHKRTGQTIRLTFETDRNLDGVFDEKDLEVHYDYKLAVLTTRIAFSCGNLFPILMQENGAVLLGEPTTGGSCCVQLESTLDGTIWAMSSYLMGLVDSEGNSVEGGCKVDLPITRKSFAIPFLTEKTGVSLTDYEAYFRDESLVKMINEWYGESELSAAA